MACISSLLQLYYVAVLKGLISNRFLVVAPTKMVALCRSDTILWLVLIKRKYLHHHLSAFPSERPLLGAAHKTTLLMESGIITLCQQLLWTSYMWALAGTTDFYMLYIFLELHIGLSIHVSGLCVTVTRFICLLFKGSLPQDACAPVWPFMLCSHLLVPILIWLLIV